MRLVWTLLLLFGLGLAGLSMATDPTKDGSGDVSTNDDGSPMPTPPPVR